MMIHRSDSSSDLPPRIRDAESRAEFRRKLDASSLGAPDAKAAIARRLRYDQALPDRWVQLSEPDLRRLLDDYRDRRETWHEDHETALSRVFAEIDFEPAQAGLTD